MDPIPNNTPTLMPHLIMKRQTNSSIIIRLSRNWDYIWNWAFAFVIKLREIYGFLKTICCALKDYNLRQQSIHVES